MADVRFEQPDDRQREVISSRSANLQPLILTTMIAVVAAGTGLALAHRQKPSAIKGETTARETQPKTVAPVALTEDVKRIDQLDGIAVDSAVANRRPIAVMIENHPEARPQSGLGQASVVYEALAEGGITRFMAVFDHVDTVKVGPIRSARMYYLDWALEYDAAYAHVGGNIAALDLIPKLGIKDLNEFAIGERAFQRIPQVGKAIEHTMYTNLVKLRQIADQKFGLVAHSTQPIFKQPLERDKRPAGQTITIDFSAPSYLVTWKYDPDSNLYLRFLAGSPHKDANTGVQLKAANIIVQRVARQAITSRDGKETFSMTTIGSGKADIYQDGQKIEGSWKKTSHSDPTKFLDPDGKEIARNPGQTWIEIVPPENTVTVTNN